MIKEQDGARIAIDAGIAIGALEAIANVAREQGQIHENYLREKVTTAQYCIDFIKSFCEVYDGQ